MEASSEEFIHYRAVCLQPLAEVCLLAPPQRRTCGYESSAAIEI